MQFSPHDIKEKLLKALDKDNNVVDMPSVVEVVSTLEEYPFTRESLEQTRIGKHVNDMRKKTNNKDLAKRAKNLLRKWQQFISPGSGAAQEKTPASGATRPVNGEGLTTGSTYGAGTPLSNLPVHMQKHFGNSKPASPASRPTTPASNKSNVSPPSLPSHSALSSPGSSQPGTPSLNNSSKLSPRLARSSMLANSSSSKPTSPVLPARMPAGIDHYSTPASSRSRLSPNMQPRHLHSSLLAGKTKDNSRPSTPSETLSKVNVANKRKRRLEEQCINAVDDGIASKRAANGDTSCDAVHSSDSNMTIHGKTLDSSKLVNGLVHDCHHPHQQKQCGSHDLECESNLQAGYLERERLNNTQTSLSTPSKACVPGSALDGSGDMLQTPSGNHRTPLVLRIDTSSLDIAGKSDLTPSSLSDKSDRGHLERTPSLNALRTPKVKTTAQLIQDLHASGGIRIGQSKTVTKIALNQIEKEADLPAESVVPAAAKPRPRRKPGTAPPPSSEKALSQTKHEMVHKFLQTAVTPAASELALLDLIKHDQEQTAHESPEDLQVPRAKEYSPPAVVAEDSLDSAAAMIEGAPARVPDGLRTSQLPEPKATQGVDPWTLLPPLDPDSIDLDDDVYEPPAPVIVDADILEKLHSDHWSGVNGQYDHQHQWHQWSQTLSLPSYNGDLLHILPYVSIDD